MGDVRPVSTDSGYEELDFLLPNGFMITMSCDRRDSLGQVKTSLWEKAVQLPAANLLRNSSHYVFVGVNHTSVEEEYDDNTYVGDLSLVRNILEVSVPRMARELNKLHRNIGLATNVQVHILEDTSEKIPEFKRVREYFRQYCHKIATNRERWSIDRQALFFYPPNLDRNEDLPTCTARKIMQHPDFKITLNVWFYDMEGKSKYAVSVPAPDCPSRVIETALVARETDKGYAPEEVAAQARASRDNFVLKLCDKEEYLFMECCIHKYEYIRNCINKNHTAELQIVRKADVIDAIPNNYCTILQQEQPSTEVFHRPISNVHLEDTKTTWDLSHDVMYSIKVRNFPVPNGDTRRVMMYVQAQLFHGDQPLCQSITTREKGFNVTWEFDVAIESLPRCARLCFTTFLRDTTEVKAINWANIQVFDHDGKLTTGRQVVRVTNFTAGSNVNAHSLGATGTNLNMMPGYDLTFDIVAPTDMDVYYPTNSYVDDLIKREDSYVLGARNELKSFELLDRIVNKDPLDQMSKYEVKFLWKHRKLAKHYQPNLLPRLVQCVRWTDRHQVFELYSLLRDWPEKELSTATTLQLIGPLYPDCRVRAIAVRALDAKLTNELMELYMLQLVQAVKLECYHQNDLSTLLLRRALQHKTIGQRLFWHLRSEMHIGLSRLKFAPILEAYCLYCGNAVFDDLLNEVLALNECKLFTTKTKKMNSLEEQHNALKTWLSSQDTKEKLEEQHSVLNQNVEMGEISVDECKVMTSKMRPLWLTWRNRSPLGADVDAATIRYIIKHGDDLRQDMLVIQLIKLMDMVWKYSCRDYWITSYDCMSLDEMFGIIEVVGEAKTVCDIEMHKQKGVMETTGMHEWLYTVSGGGTDYLDSVKRFRYSCAAFCVITYLLGIGDRHSDNIMIKKTGQLFHIDFGHFMNHKKGKYGIQRERTPFVLTKDFVRVITEGNDKKVYDNLNFQSFLYLCLEAYMTIRKNGALFLTLLSLMMYCELPELSGMTDINYCRKCLALDKPDHEAADNFYKAIMESYGGQWTTKVDWFLHRVNRVLQGMGSDS